MWPIRFVAGQSLRRALQVKPGVSPTMKLLPTVSLLVGFVGAALAQSATATLERAKVEQEVLTAALNDLATYRGDDSPIDDVFSPNPITLNPTPLRYEMSRSTVSEQR